MGARPKLGKRTASSGKILLNFSRNETYFFENEIYTQFNKRQHKNFQTRQTNLYAKKQAQMLQSLTQSTAKGSANLGH